MQQLLFMVLNYFKEAETIFWSLPLRFANHHFSPVMHFSPSLSFSLSLSVAAAFQNLQWTHISYFEIAAHQNSQCVCLRVVEDPGEGKEKWRKILRKNGKEYEEVGRETVTEDVRCSDTDTQ